MLGVPAALITQSGLIAASTDPTLPPPGQAPADLLQALADADGEPFSEITAHRTVARSNTIPWQLVCRWPEPGPEHVAETRRHGQPSG